MNTAVRCAIANVLAAPTLFACATQITAIEARGALKRCFAVARTVDNDYRTQQHVCARSSRTDRDEGAFLRVPDRTCLRIVGGQLEEIRR